MNNNKKSDWISSLTLAVRKCWTCANRKEGKGFHDLWRAYNNTIYCLGTKYTIGTSSNHEYTRPLCTCPLLSWWVDFTTTFKGRHYLKQNCKKECLNIFTNEAREWLMLMNDWSNLGFGVRRALRKRSCLKRSPFFSENGRKCQAIELTITRRSNYSSSYFVFLY